LKRSPAEAAVPPKPRLFFSSSFYLAKARVLLITYFMLSFCWGFVSLSFLEIEDRSFDEWRADAKLDRSSDFSSGFSYLFTYLVCSCSDCWSMRSEDTVLKRSPRWPPRGWAFLSSASLASSIDFCIMELRSTGCTGSSGGASYFKNSRPF